MAWTYVTGGSAGTSSSYSTSVNVGTGTERLLVVSTVTDDGSYTTTPTYNSTSLTLARQYAGSAFRVSVWYMVNPTTGSNTLSCTGLANDTGVMWQVWTGVDPSTPYHTNATVGNSVSGSITTNQTNELILGFWADEEDSSNARSPVAGVTERVDAIAGTGAGDFGQWSGSRVSTTTGSYTMGYTPDPGDAAGVIVAFYEYVGSSAKPWTLSWVA